MGMVLVDLALSLAAIVFVGLMTGAFLMGSSFGERATARRKRRRSKAVNDVRGLAP